MISVLWLKELWSYCSDDILKWGCRVSVVCYGGFRGWRMVKGTRNQQKTDRASAVSSELTVDCKHNAISHCRLYLPPYHPVFAIHLLRQGKLHRLSGTAEHLKLSITDLGQVINCCSMVLREYALYEVWQTFSVEELSEYFKLLRNHWSLHAITIYTV